MSEWDLTGHSLTRFSFVLTSPRGLSASGRAECRNPEMAEWGSAFFCILVDRGLTSSIGITRTGWAGHISESIYWFGWKLSCYDRDPPKETKTKWNFLSHIMHVSGVGRNPGQVGDFLKDSVWGCRDLGSFCLTPLALHWDYSHLCGWSSLICTSTLLQAP